MKKLLFFGGIFISLIAIFITIKDKEKISLLSNGQIIEVEIIDVPVSCKGRNRKIKPFFRFKYDDKIYSKNLKDNYCESILKSTNIFLKTNVNKTLFVYTDENITKNLFGSTILFLIGLVFIFKGVKSK